MLRGTTPANSLVRYRGMIRDMYAQEFVPAVIQEQNDGNGKNTKVRLGTCLTPLQVKSGGWRTSTLRSISRALAIL